MSSTAWGSMCENAQKTASGGDCYPFLDACKFHYTLKVHVL